MKIGVLLSGCGVSDGAEIHESVFALLAIAESQAEAVCIGVNKNQHHVVNHLTGAEENESRNMLIEAARIARGKISNIDDLNVAELDALVIPGGFGSAKNLTDWALNGPGGTIIPEIKRLILSLLKSGKPIAALCVSPVVIAKAVQGSDLKPELTLGTDQAPSEFDIAGFAAGLESTGSRAVMKANDEIQIDRSLRIVSAPCYMMKTDLVTLRKNISDAVRAIVDLHRESLHEKQNNLAQ